MHETPGNVFSPSTTTFRRWSNAFTIAAALDGKDPGLANFDIDGIRKDLSTMLAEAKVRGVSLPLVERAFAVYDDACKDGWGRRDGAALPAYWPTRSG